MTTETYSQIGINRPSIRKDPSAVLDYTFDWTDWLDLVTDTISTRVVTVSGVVLDSNQILAGSKKVTVWISGGTAGEVAFVDCKIVTVGGRTDERRIYLIVENR